MPIKGTKKSRTEKFVRVLERVVLEKRYLGVNSLEAILKHDEPINPFEWISLDNTIPRTATYAFDNTFAEMLRMGADWEKIQTRAGQLLKTLKEEERTRKRAAKETEPLLLDEYTYGDPYLSLWQSAAHAVSVRSVIAPGSELEKKLVEPIHVLRRALHTDKDRGQRFRSELETWLKGGARIAADFLLAEMIGDTAQSKEIRESLPKSEYDLGWIECFEEYFKFKGSRKGYPYRKDGFEEVIPDRVKIAIIGDWGTGEEPALNVLRHVKKLCPNVLIHLGDVYYAGTEDEMRYRFVQPCRQELDKTRLYSLCGNHDMYAGKGYDWLLDNMGQRASHFSLANQYWQILCMDTGNMDRNPLTVTTNMTSVYPAEVKWLRTKISKPGQKNTILMSHHQLFSPFKSVGCIDGVRFGYNPHLYEAFKDQLESVECWFWGHEHTLAVYDPYMGLTRGRCIGCSAVPVLAASTPYKSDPDLKTLDQGAFPTWNKRVQLGSGGTFMNHSFAMLELNDTEARIEYYEVPSATPEPLWREEISPTRRATS